MATVTASQLVPRSTHFNCYETLGLVTKSNMAQMGFRNQSMTHSGLRSLNVIDRLQMKTDTKVGPRKAVKNGQQSANNVPSKKVLCGQGSNFVFVGTEVGPWSKTGGLGDVLGGLPPALAVSSDFLFCLIPFNAGHRLT